MAMSLGNAGQTSVKSEPNVVPMIDIMLVLLIIFMIVTPMISAGFKAEMPRGAHLDSRPEEEGEMILGIDEEGRYFLNSRPMAEAAIEDQLRTEYADRMDKRLYLKADSDLPFSKVEAAVEMGRRAGVAVLAAITEQSGASMLEKEKK